MSDDQLTCPICDGPSSPWCAPTCTESRCIGAYEERLRIAADLRNRVRRMTGASAEGHGRAAAMLDLADALDGGSDA